MFNNFNNYNGGNSRIKFLQMWTAIEVFNDKKFIKNSMTYILV